MSKTDLNIINKYRTAIMGFAALWIFLFHEQEHEWIKVFFSPEFLSRSMYFVKRIGYCGVDIFLLLSGIGLVYAREKHDLFSFYIRRIERVFVPFFIVAVVLMIYEKWSFVSFFKKVFLYDFLFVELNSFLWFIPAIIILYICFPLYYKLFKNARNKVVFTICAYATWLVLSLLCKGFLRTDIYSFTNRIPIFLTGIMLAWLLREKEIKITKLFWIILAASFLAGLTLLFMTNYRNLYLLVPISNACIPTFLLALSGTFILAKFFSLINTCAVGTLIIKIFSFLGTISLEIYCVQEKLDDVIRPMITGSVENWMSNFFWINLAIAFAVFFVALLLHHISKWLGKIIFHNKTLKIH